MKDNKDLPYVSENPDEISIIHVNKENLIRKESEYFSREKELKNYKQIFSSHEKLIKKNNFSMPEDYKFEFKTKSKEDYKSIIKLSYNPNIITPRLIGRNQGLFLESDTQITPANIAEFAYPIVQFMQQMSPDYVIACDRGARLLGLAVHLLYQELYGELPTKNHSVMFRRISRSVPTEETAALLKPDIEKMTSETQNPRILVLDDWVSSGQTKDITQAVIKDLSGGKAEVLYGVMRGSGANITGKPDSMATAQWHDNPDLIGVDYSRSGTKPSRVDSKSALEYRQRIAANIKKFADGIKSGNPVTARRPLAKEEIIKVKEAA